MIKLVIWTRISNLSLFAQITRVSNNLITINKIKTIKYYKTEKRMK